MYEISRRGDRRVHDAKDDNRLVTKEKGLGVL